MGAKGQGSCCTKENPCDEGGGDCDAGKGECAPGLVCGKDNCKYYNKNALSWADCCEPGYYRVSNIVNIELTMSW